MSTILTVKNLTTSFFTYAGEVQAVRGIDFTVEHGEAVGFVGESGCGKSVTMSSIMGILDDAGRITGGTIRFNNDELTTLSSRKMQRIRGNEIAMIFQDPMTSLNPVYTIGNQMIEHQRFHKRTPHTEAYKQAVDMLELVGLPNAKEQMKSYPHELSGGMRQRVMIAMALVMRPKLLIADEPTTALDVTIQAQILDIMKSVRKELDTAIILVTHDLGVVASICDRVNVMYGGKIIESATTERLYAHGQHPYTWGLLRSVPNPKSKQRERLKSIVGQPPDLLKPPQGCPFAPRCDRALQICAQVMPPVFEVDTQHSTACWLLHPQAASAGLERSVSQ